MQTAFSSRRSPHLRVHEMLRGAREHTLVTPVSHSSESLMRNTPTYSQAFASTMNTNQPQWGGGRTPSNALSTLNSTQNTKVCVFVFVVVFLTALFITIGSYADHQLQTYKETDSTIDFQTHVTLLVVQLLFNVALVALPYIALYNYAPDSYACQYYLVIAACWVVSLHAQPHLKDRFYALWGDASSNAPSTKDHDSTIIAQHLQEAEDSVRRKPRSPQHHREPENLQYQTNPAVRIAPSTVPHISSRMPMDIERSAITFHSNDLLPHTPSHEPAPQGTNIADLL